MRIDWRSTIMKRKNLVVLGLLTAVMVGVGGCGSKTADSTEDTDPTVVVTEAESDSTAEVEDTDSDGMYVLDGKEVSKAEFLEELEKYRCKGETDEYLMSGHFNDGVEITPEEYNEYCMETFGMTGAQYELYTRRKYYEAIATELPTDGVVVDEYTDAYGYRWVEYEDGTIYRIVVEYPIKEDYYSSLDEVRSSMWSIGIIGVEGESTDSIVDVTEAEGEDESSATEADTADATDAIILPAKYDDAYFAQVDLSKEGIIDEFTDKNGKIWIEYEDGRIYRLEDYPVKQYGFDGLSEVRELDTFEFPEG